MFTANAYETFDVFDNSIKYVYVFKFHVVNFMITMSCYDALAYKSIADYLITIIRSMPH